MLKSYFIIVGFVLILIGFSTCKKKDDLPLITSLRPCLITDVSAKCGGVIYSDGDSKIIERGLCYSDFTNLPTTNDQKVICDGSESSFSGDLKDLGKSKKYYVRAYAKNASGISYGSTMEFATFSVSPYPSVFTKGFGNLGSTVVQCDGEIIPTNVSQIIDYGICISRSNSPSVNDQKISCSSSSYLFNATISNLSGNTRYYFRAYATNKDGVGYGDVVSFVTYYGSVTDIDGNIYNTIKIGDQEWMASNLRVTRYRSGTPVEYVTVDSDWLNKTSGTYCAYNNSSSYEFIYGKLYNWYAINYWQGLAPAGWHIPTQTEWATLLSTIGGDIAVAGSKLSERGGYHWLNGGGTNEYSFNALPSGVRGSDGFYYISQVFTFWSNTTLNNGFGTMYSYGSAQPPFSSVEKYYGCSVRCVKD